jgi:hypothetical protein
MSVAAWFWMATENSPCRLILAEAAGNVARLSGVATRWCRRQKSRFLPSEIGSDGPKKAPQATFFQ